MSKKPTFLDLYYEWMEKGVLSTNGLCESLEFRIGEKLYSLFELMHPTTYDEDRLREDGYGLLFWASGLVIADTALEDRLRSFTPLRQTIILFCAALNNEL